jgi:hypothetical protein
MGGGEDKVHSSELAIKGTITLSPGWSPSSTEGVEKARTAVKDHIEEIMSCSEINGQISDHIDSKYNGMALVFHHCEAITLLQ